MTLRLVECDHFWLEMKTAGGKVIALCKFCRKRGEFPMADWVALGAEKSLNKPIRL